MSRAPRTMRVGIVTMTALVLGAFPALAAGLTTTTFSFETTPEIFITELQTTNTTASEEFIEVYNNTERDIDFADLASGGKDLWKLQFFSSTATANGSPDWAKPSATVSLSGVIQAQSYYLLSTAQSTNGVTTIYKPGSIEPEQTYSARLSDTGGGLQLVDTTSTVTIVHDRLVWQKPVEGQLLPNGVLATPQPGGSLQRIPDASGAYVQDDGSLASFDSESQITPKDAWLEPSAPAESEQTTGSDMPDTATSYPGQADIPPATNEQKAAQIEPEITELLPNPASPQNDSENEYIELYNPNTTSFDLTGYTLEAGTATLHDFTFTGGATLPPKSYTAFFSSLSKISLANGGGQVRLLSADKETVSETSDYTTAPQGQAWSWNGNNWQWTTTPTPGAPNIFTLPAISPVTIAATKNTKTSAIKSTPKVRGVSTTKSSTKKSATKSTKKANSKKSSTAHTSSQTGAAQDTAQVTPLHPWTLAAVGIAAILYGVYEYRVDIKNYFYRRTADRAARRAARAQA